MGDLLKGLSRVSDIQQQREAANKASYAAMKGFRVTGHRMSMSDGRLRIYGPQAVSVAQQARIRMGVAAQKAIKDSLS